jgi:hypothetical protein
MNFPLSILDAGSRLLAVFASTKTLPKNDYHLAMTNGRRREVSIIFLPNTVGWIITLEYVWAE